MRYEQIRKGVFHQRPNRFIALVELDGVEIPVHVKNTGRCKELLTPGAAVYLEQAKSDTRKTKYDLVAVEKGDRLINIDAQAPNQIFREWALEEHFQPHLRLLKAESRYGNSRFDFYWESLDGRAGYVEVKGVTLEKNGAVYFPEAPTQRGVKHIKELIRAREEGYETALFFVIQMTPADFFSPNDHTHPAFGAALRMAAQAGVLIFAYDCMVTPNDIVMHLPVEIQL